MKIELFSYDDITLIPNHSSLNSRNNADTSIELCGYRFKLPIVPSNMIDVISFENARFLAENGYFYIMHRFENATRLFIDYAILHKLPMVSISVGVNTASKNDLYYAIDKIGYDGIHWICIDIAHGDHDKTGAMIDYIRVLYKDHKCPKIIAGNVATSDGYQYLVKCGADVIKCGIGQGSICTTRYKTGFHIPTAYSIWDCVTNGNRNIPIIADGGAKHFGDVAKALVLGADMIMSGRWFAECLDSPAKIEHGKKIYRGSTSYEAKGHNNHVEGQTLEITKGCTYMERMKEIHQALSSAISYGGGKDLSCFNSVKWYLIHH